MSTSTKEQVTTSPRDIPYGEQGFEFSGLKSAGAAERTTAGGGRSPRPSSSCPTGAHHRAVAHRDRRSGRSVADDRRGARGVVADCTPGLRRPRAGTTTRTGATSVLGIDETRRGKPRRQRCTDTGRWIRCNPIDTGFVDLAGVQFVAIDPAAGLCHCKQRAQLGLAADCPVKIEEPV